MMKREIGERRRETLVSEWLWAKCGGLESCGGGDGFCGSHFWRSNGTKREVSGGGDFIVWRLEKRPPRTTGRFWEGLR